jgi:hypothetical protein
MSDEKFRDRDSPHMHAATAVTLLLTCAFAALCVKLMQNRHYVTLSTMAPLVSSVCMASATNCRGSFQLKLKHEYRRISLFL